MTQDWVLGRSATVQHASANWVVADRVAQPSEARSCVNLLQQASEVALELNLADFGTSGGDIGISILPFEGSFGLAKDRVAESYFITRPVTKRDPKTVREVIQPLLAGHTSLRCRIVVRRSFGGQCTGRSIIPMTHSRRIRSSSPTDTSTDIGTLRRNLSAQMTPEAIRSQARSIRDWRLAGIRERAPLVAKQIGAPDLARGGRNS